MKPINILELHVSHACNLTCASCSHYSNHGHRGNIAVEEADGWMSAWSDRVTVNNFHLLGGEPTIHPELSSFPKLVRRHWPQARIVVKTNGFLLHRHPLLPAALAEAGNSVIMISWHHHSEEYQRRLRPVGLLAEKWTREFGIEILWIDSYRNWTQRYQGSGAAMTPFEDGNPRKSWEICPARNCKQLFEGKIWKCAPLAYLPMQHSKFGLSAKWQSYLTYEPLAPSCSDDALDRFLALQDEAACSMCSAERRHTTTPLPFRGGVDDDTQMESV